MAVSYAHEHRKFGYMFQGDIFGGRHIERKANRAPKPIFFNEIRGIAKREQNMYMERN
jgi:hypothetical protein